MVIDGVFESTLLSCKREFSALRHSENRRVCFFGLVWLMSSLLTTVDDILALDRGGEGVGLVVGSIE